MNPGHAAARGCRLGRRLTCLSALLITLISNAQLVHGSSPEQSVSLMPGSVVEGVFDNVDTATDSVDVAHRYPLPKKKTAQPWRLVVRQRGIDVRIVEWRDGRPVGELNHYRDRFEEEVFRLSTSIQAVEVRPVKGGEAGGTYSLRLELPVGESKQRQRVETDLTEAARVSLLGDAESEAMARAAEIYESAALELLQPAEPGSEHRRHAAQAWLSAANHRRILGDAEKALELYSQSAELWRQLQRPGMLAASQVGVGQSLRRLGRLDAARQALGEALALWQTLPRRQTEIAQTETNLGLIAHFERDYPLALELYQRALATHRRLAGQDAEIGNLLLNMGSVAGRLGQAEEALDHTRRSLEIFRRLGDRRAELDALVNLASLHRRMADHERSLALYDQATGLAAALGDVRSRGRLLNNRGYTYLALGRFDRAATDFELAHQLAGQVDDHLFAMVSEKNLAEARYLQGRSDQAKDHWRAALESARGLEHRAEAEILAHLGRLDAELGEDNRYFEQAWQALPSASSLEDQARLHRLQGEAHLAGADADAALDSFHRAAKLWRQLQDPVGLILAEIGSARAERLNNRPEAARAHLESAVTSIESQRLEMANPNLRAAFVGARHEAYDLLIDTMVDLAAKHPQQGFTALALQIAERAKGRRLLDYLLEPTPSRPEVARLRDRRLAAARRLGLLARRQELVRRGRQRPAPGEDLARQVADLQARLDLLDARRRELDPRRGVLESSSDVTVAAMRDLLDPQTALLHYALGDSRSHLWLVTGSTLTHVALPPRSVIDHMARKLHQAWGGLGDAAEPQQQAAATLSSTLLAPLDLLDPKIRRLVIVADGALHYVPFSALPRPAENDNKAIPLVSHFELTRIPSAAVLRAERLLPDRRDPSGPKLAVLADPVFDRRDSRFINYDPAAADGESETAPVALRRGTGEADEEPLGRLPGSGAEALAIAARLPADETYLALGFEANRSALDGPLSRSAWLHFATHGVIDTEHPELSGLALSQFHADGRFRNDGFLRLFEIYELDLDTDLVVLSGCRTALGRELSGEAFQSLAAGFLQAGARRVLASLWPISDRATVDLMGNFYDALLIEGSTPAAALRQAQLKMRQDRRYSDPYFWAGFVLQGDWR